MRVSEALVPGIKAALLQGHRLAVDDFIAQHGMEDFLDTVQGILQDLQHDYTFDRDILVDELKSKVEELEDQIDELQEEIQDLKSTP